MSENLPKCSKCGSSPCTYRELATTAIAFDLTDTKFNAVNETSNPNYQGVRKIGFNHCGVTIESVMEEPDNTGKVEAECSGCGHRWLLRNFRTIEKLIELHGFNEAASFKEIK